MKGKSMTQWYYVYGEQHKRIIWIPEKQLVISYGYGELSCDIGSNFEPDEDSSNIKDIEVSDEFIEQILELEEKRKNLISKFNEIFKE